LRIEENRTMTRLVSETAVDRLSKIACKVCNSVGPCDHDVRQMGFLPPEVSTFSISEVASDRSALIEAIAEYAFQRIQEGNWYISQLDEILCDAKHKSADKVTDALKRRIGK
jgi:hypothetical protein